ncbi:MAG: hypothetical protein IKU47_03335 [Oscillospiraceae bacterium]|nr:hypothetical protein [Oscillospiraceae bacterium]
MIKFGKKATEKIYYGVKQVQRIYKGVQLWYIYHIERFITAISGLLIKSTANLEKAISGQLKAIGKMFSGASATVETDVLEHTKAEGNASSIADVKGGAGHTEKIKATDNYISAVDVTLTDHNGNIQVEEQHIFSRDIAHARSGTTQPQKAENHILFTQKAPTADKGEVLSQTIKEDMKMHLTDKVAGGVGHARPQKAKVYSFFTQSKPELLTQTFLPVPQFVKMFVTEIGKIAGGKTKPQTTENSIDFTAEPVKFGFGRVIPRPEKTELHIADTVTGGAGHAQPQTAVGKGRIANLVHLTDETTDVTVETGANTDNDAFFDKGYGKGIKAENGGISGADSIVYKPKKVFDIDNAGGISASNDSVLYKPDKLFKTDELVKSSNFTRLFRIVCMSAQTTAKLVTEAPLFRYIFLNADTGAVSSSSVTVGETTNIGASENIAIKHTAIFHGLTYEEMYGWAAQHGNVLYIYQSNTAAQAENVLSIDTDTAEAWHTQTENILFINTASTAEQIESELAIDTLETLNTDEWAVQENNVLLINGIIDNEIEVI